MAKKQEKGKLKETVFFGLDLAWSERNPSGCAVIQQGRLAAHSGELGGNDEILGFVREHLPRGSGAVLAVDAPLRVPNETGMRDADRFVSRDFRRFHAGAYPANRRRLAQGDGAEKTVRGEVLVDALATHMRFSETAAVPKRAVGRLVCEVYPHPAHVSLFGLETTLKYKPRSQRSYEDRWAEFARYQQLLRSLRDAKPPLKGTKKLLKKTDVYGLRGKALKQYEDTLDAITCAYVAYFLWWHGPQRARTYGDLEHGHIIVPLTKSMQKRLDTGA